MVFIGMLTVRPMEGNFDLGSAIGASVNVLLFTRNSETYQQEVVIRMNDFGYEVLEIEDVEAFDAEEDYSDDLKEKAQLLTSENPLQWGTFYTFDSFEEDDD